jgi:hypothetical protein
MKTTLLFLIATSCIFAHGAAATTNVACVSTTAELANALSTLSNSTSNTDSDEIRVRIGTYIAPASGFKGAVTNHHDLTIHGGYLDAACTQQTLDASMTVLDGNHATSVMTIDTIEIPSSDIEVSGLTFQNGSGGSAFASNAGGLKIGEPNPISGGKILVERNVFRNNSAASNVFSQAVGGLLAATDGTPLIVRGNLFVGNSSPNAAAASFYSNNEIDVSNNTFTGNRSTDMDAPTRVTIDYPPFTGLKLSNNIFWGNNVGSGAFDLNLSGAGAGQIGATLRNNDVQASTGMAVSAAGTLNVDPVFVGAGDFRLAPLSLLINAGVNDPAGGLAGFDLDGAPRLDGIAVDLGAYESSYVFSDGFE